MRSSPKDDRIQHPGAIRSALLVILLLSGITGCAPAPSDKSAAPSVLSVAVWDLERFDGGPDPEWGEVLSSAVIQVFEESGRYTVVERERLILALEELHLGTSALADERTRLRIGKIVGARYMVFGGYLIMGGQMRVDLRLVEVETGRIVRAARRAAGAVSLVEGIDAARSAAGDLL